MITFAVQTLHPFATLVWYFIVNTKSKQNVFCSYEYNVVINRKIKYLDTAKNIKRSFYSMLYFLQYTLIIVLLHLPVKISLMMQDRVCILIIIECLNNVFYERSFRLPPNVGSYCNFKISKILFATWWSWRVKLWWPQNSY